VDVFPVRRRDTPHWTPTIRAERPDGPRSDLGTDTQCEKLARKKYLEKTVHHRETEETTTTGTGTGTTTTTTTGTTTGTTGATTGGTTGTTGTTTGTAGTTTGGTTKPTKAEVEQVKTLFDATCTLCHGMKGEGVPSLAPPYGPELPRSESQKGVVEQLTNPLNEKGLSA
jgi:hypothetical protein